MTEHFSQLNMSATRGEGVLQTRCDAAAQLHGTDKVKHQYNNIGNNNDCVF